MSYMPIKLIIVIFIMEKDGRTIIEIENNCANYKRKQNIEII